MQYEGQICRGPMERGSYMLPVAVGCRYNRCRFCMLFKHLRYRELPLEDIDRELLRIRSLGASPKQIFLGDGSAFCMDTPHLMEVLTLIRRRFPDVERIHMDATVPGIAQKSDGELQTLYELGVRRLYLGIETGLGDVLAFMDKGHTLSAAYAQTRRLQSGGIEYGAHIMTGIAGAGRGLENARATAEFLSRTAPAAIINFSMFLHKSAPLYTSIADGTFSPAPELECLQEERLLLSLLETEGLQYDGFHDAIPLRVRGLLPRDKGKMLGILDAAIARQENCPPVYAWME